MKKILVTGSSGFIGQHVMSSLEKRGFQVHSIKTNGSPSQFSYPLDLLNASQSDLNKLIGMINPSHLLHLAWYVEPNHFWQSSENLQWIGATLRLYQSFVKHGGKRFVSAGTCAEYSWPEVSDGSLTILDEITSEQNPSTLYGQSKLSQMQVLEKMAIIDGTSLSWGRIFFLYGIGEKKGRLISDAVLSLLKGQKFNIKDNTKLCDFMDVRDVADAFAALCDCNVAGPVNISTGIPLYISDVLQELENIVKTKNLIIYSEKSSNKQMQIVGNPNRLNNEVGFTPSLSLDRSLQDTVKWWMTH